MLRRNLGLRILLRKERVDLAPTWCTRNPAIRTKGITSPPSISM
jgi:hypothetical protein